MFRLLWQRQIIVSMLVFIISNCDFHPHLQMQLTYDNLALLYGIPVLGLTCVSKSLSVQKIWLAAQGVQESVEYPGRVAGTLCLCGVRHQEVCTSFMCPFYIF